jgi:hypothetical protein
VAKKKYKEQRITAFRNPQFSETSTCPALALKTSANNPTNLSSLAASLYSSYLLDGSSRYQPHSYI